MCCGIPNLGLGVLETDTRPPGKIDGKAGGTVWHLLSHVRAFGQESESRVELARHMTLEQRQLRISHPLFSHLPQ